MKTARDYSPALWRRLVIIHDRLESFLDRRGYDVATTPILESTDLFLRKSGGELASQMYSFTDPSGRQVSLRPELTSSVVRQFIDGNLKGPMPQRWQYYGTVFRYEASADGVDAPGDLEFQQLGAEILGSASEFADAEVLATAVQGLTTLGVTGHKLRVGHMGVVNAMLDALGLSERARVFVVNSFDDLRSGDAGVEIVRQRATDLGLLGEERTQALSQLARSMAPEDAEGMVEGFLAQGVMGLSGQRTPEEVFRRYLRKLKEAGVPELVDAAIRFSAELVALTGPADDVRKKLGELIKRFDLDAAVLAPVDKLLKALGQYDLKGVPVILDLGMARGIAYYTGVVFDPAEGDRIGESLGANKAVILRNHGLLTVGRTVDEAAWWFISMERSCQAQLLAEAAGIPIPIDPAQAKATAGLVGNPVTGYFSFQPIYDVLMKEEPDFLD